MNRAALSNAPIQSDKHVTDIMLPYLSGEKSDVFLTYRPNVQQSDLLLTLNMLHKKF